jgi:hypothetical protein
MVFKYNVTYDCQNGAGQHKDAVGNFVFHLKENKREGMGLVKYDKL